MPTIKSILGGQGNVSSTSGRTVYHTGPKVEIPNNQSTNNGGPQIFAVDPVQAAVDKVANNINGVLASTADISTVPFAPALVTP